MGARLLQPGHQMRSASGGKRSVKESNRYHTPREGPRGGRDVLARPPRADSYAGNTSSAFISTAVAKKQSGRFCHDPVFRKMLGGQFVHFVTGGALY